MRKFSKGAVIAALVGVSVSVGACSKVGELKARMAFKDANALYQAQDYRRAAQKYEEALAADPNLTVAHFYLGNSYDNLYKSTRKGEAENDAFIEKAITSYKTAAEKLCAPESPCSENDALIKRRSLEFLVNAYGPDKLNDPAQAEPILQKMIELDPKDPANYFVLAKIYEDTGNYEQAEATFLKAKEARPNDPSVHVQLASYYNRQGEFEKTMQAFQERAQVEPNNPEAYYTMATYYWEKAQRDFRLPDADKRKYVALGLENVDKALSLKSDYHEALVYKNLLYRTQANLEKDPAKQQQLLKEADKLRDQAQTLQKQKRASGSN
jgi:tetratricopeptide (TPR) repeat protein